MRVTASAQYDICKADGTPVDPLPAFGPHLAGEMGKVEIAGRTLFLCVRSCALDGRAEVVFINPAGELLLETIPDAEPCPDEG